jgi:hypothetical protein
MKRKGIGSVVAYVLLIALAVIAVSVFLGVYLRSVQKGTSSDSSSCFGIDLEVKSCVAFTVGTLNSTGLPDTNPLIFMNVERHPGGKDVKGLRFVVTNSSEEVRVEKPVDFTFFNTIVSTNYSSLKEYNSVDAVIRDISSVSSFTDVKVTVGAVVGKSETVCAPTRLAVKCAWA